MNSWVSLALVAERAILGLLVLLSVGSVTLMIERWRYFRRLRSRESLAEVKALLRQPGSAEIQLWLQRQAQDARGVGLLGGVLRAAMETPVPTTEAVDRAVRSYLVEERQKMERGFTVLATLGSNAPFVGLLGTVLGIMAAFAELANQSGGTQGVIGGVSSALIATAVGLFVAIPAVVAYNFFSRQARSLLVATEVVRDLYLSRMRS